MQKTFEGSGPNSAGSTYEGDWLGEKKHGFGEWRSNDGLAWYKGEWKENKRHGEGEFHWASGAWYRGHWRNGVKHGYGEYHGEDGGTLKGEFFDNENALADSGVRFSSSRPLRCYSLTIFVWLGVLTTDNCRGPQEFEASSVLDGRPRRRFLPFLRPHSE